MPYKRAKRKTMSWQKGGRPARSRVPFGHPLHRVRAKQKERMKTSYRYRKMTASERLNDRAYRAICRISELELDLEQQKKLLKDLKRISTEHNLGINVQTATRLTPSRWIDDRTSNAIYEFTHHITHDWFSDPQLRQIAEELESLHY